ncbi:MAG: imidazole glycerol phosphate synthase subunit HisH [Myxococcales bacterium]|nr:imidazole glycerol phosphate synthase subunit HisH [Myxococcales bacterium]
MRITLLDLGVGNLHSLEKALAAATNAEVVVETDVSRALDGELVVLPGVGAFTPAATRLASFRGEIRKALADGFPCIGVCLGMQLLFESSEEGEGDGIGLVPGRVTKLATARTPHMGWSPVRPAPHAPAWPWPRAVYYAHSFACRAERQEDVLATTTLEGDTFPAVVRHANTVGCQFHPEKSSAEGVALLGTIVREVTT